MCWRSLTQKVGLSPRYPIHANSTSNWRSFSPGLPTQCAVQYAPDKVQKVLVGNKSDDVGKRQVATEQAHKLAESYGMDFFETSAYNNNNITECFTRLAEQVLAANKKDLDLLRMSITEELDLTALEDEEGIGGGSAGTGGDSSKGCWC
ncbi:hypothetical protein NHX12_026413 [Muraenolepis orangiensis]|uniref:small monomeric GTPase n=1 Tax=Muraenolepis orangiensis TaxID=630683 RepID=A0A9Q0IQR8_9TELE|nr:hypothetical protein NHX12_026413 [Muraenolepis orangiensis]